MGVSSCKRKANRKKWIIILVVELICLLYGISLFMKAEKTYVFQGAELCSGAGIYMEEFELGGFEDGYYLDNSMRTEDGTLSVFTPPLTLPRGSYTVTIGYTTNADKNYYSVSSKYGQYHAVVGRQKVPLESGSHDVTFPLSSPYNIDGYQISVAYGGDGYLFVNSVEISETAVWKRIVLFWIIMISGITDIVLFTVAHKKETPILCREQKIVIITILAVTILSSLPVCSPYLPDGHDLNFHLYRIEGIKNALSEGQFPVRVSSSWNNGYGYAVSVFYGELLLYIPALLRMIGFSIQAAYKCYMLGINLLTCLIAYGSLKFIFRDNKVSLIGGAVYTLAPYRLMSMYLRAAVGEYTAMAFFPLIACGIYRIFSEETEEKGYKYNWIPAVVGFSGVIQSHIISTAICGVFMGIVCLVFIKRTFKKQRFLQLCKVVIYTVLLNFWFLVPFLDYMRYDYQFNVSDGAGSFGAYGTFISQLLALFPDGSGVTVSAASGIEEYSEMPYAIGAGIIAGCFFYLYCRIVCVDENKKRSLVYKMGDTCLILGIAAALMSTIYFPWSTLQQWSDIVVFFTQNIQFPWRFLGVASCLLSLTTACAVYAFKRLKTEWGFCGLGIIVVLTLASSGWFLEDYMGHTKWLYCMDEQSIDSCIVIGGEYFPAGTDTAIFADGGLLSDEGILIRGYGKENGEIRVCCQNVSEELRNVDVSFLYYPGYAAADMDTREKLEVMSGTGGRVRVLIPGDYNGTFIVKFSEPWYWRCSEIISIIVILLFCRRWWLEKRKKLR